MGLAGGSFTEPEFAVMAEGAPNLELMPSLGRLVRGLSALFWGLPVTFLVCYYTAKADTLRPLGVVPPLACTGLLIFGLWHLGAFQKQERVWRKALDLARVLGLVNFGLSPFLFWWNQSPNQVYFLMMVGLMMVSSLMFLGSINVVLRRLGAMLPDETLRLETRQFTAINQFLLLAAFVLGASYATLANMPRLPLLLQEFLYQAERIHLWWIVVLVLLPMAITMALLWKTKEVILENVFAPKA